MAATLSEELRASHLAYKELGKRNVTSVDRIICDEAEIKLSAKRTQEALDGVVHPAAVLTQSQVIDAFKKPYGMDKIKPGSNPPELEHSTGTGSQEKRIETGTTHIKALYELKTYGYDNMQNNTLKTYLQDTLGNSLAADSAFMAVKKRELPADIFTPPKYPKEWVRYCKSEAVHMLRNPEVAQRIIEAGVDACNVPVSIDYKGLQALLLDVHVMEDDITKLTNKIGKPADNSKNPPVQASGLYADIETMRTNFDAAYKVVVDHTKSPPIVRGSSAEIKYQVEQKILEKENIKTKCKNLARDFNAKDRRNTYKKTSNGIDVYSFVDPITNTQVERDPADSVIAAEIVNDYEQKAIQLEGEIQAYKDEVKRINNEQEAAQKAIDSKVTELREAEAKLAQTQKDLPAKKQALADKQAEVKAKEEERAQAVVNSLGEGVRQAAAERRAAVKEAAPSVEEQQKAEIETILKREISLLFFDKKSHRFNKRGLEEFRKELDTNGLEFTGKDYIKRVFYENFFGSSRIKPEFAHLQTTLRNMLSPDNARDTASFVVTQILMIAQLKAPNLLRNNLTAEEVYMRSLQGDILPALIHEASKRTDLKDQIDAIKAEMGEGNGKFEMGKMGGWALLILGILLFSGAGAGAFAVTGLAGKAALGVATAAGVATARQGVLSLKS